jgi:hypothetical protein
MKVMRETYNILVRRPKEKRPLGRPRYRWEDNIRMDLREIRSRMESGRLDASDSGQGQVSDFCEHANKASGSIKGRKFLE